MEKERRPKPETRRLYRSSALSLALGPRKQSPLRAVSRAIEKLSIRARLRIGDVNIARLAVGGE